MDSFTHPCEDADTNGVDVDLWPGMTALCHLSLCRVALSYEMIAATFTFACGLPDN